MAVATRSLTSAARGLHRCRYADGGDPRSCDCHGVLGNLGAAGWIWCRLFAFQLAPFRPLNLTLGATYHYFFGGRALCIYVVIFAFGGNALIASSF